MLLFLGDLLYDHDVIQPDIQELAHYIQKNDYRTILNLEAPLKSEQPIRKWINLYQSDSIIEVLKLLNVVAVNISNNHIMDWGRAGLTATLRALDEAGILYFGAGLTIEDALRPKVVKCGHHTVGLIGFGWDEEMCVYATENKAGVAPLKETIIVQSLEMLRPLVDVVVVNLHWGYEYELYPLPIHRQLAQVIIDCGADLIIGHHPHVVQAFELYKGKSIYYSLGNFYFGSMRKRFEKVIANKVHLDKGTYGLGISIDLQSCDMERIFFISSSSETQLAESFAIKDISDISLLDYNRKYKKLRTSTRKPALYMGRWQTLINPVKLKMSQAKDQINKFSKPYLEKIGLYDFIRSKYREIIKLST